MKTAEQVGGGGAYFSQLGLCVPLVSFNGLPVMYLGLSGASLGCSRRITGTAAGVHVL